MKQDTLAASLAVVLGVLCIYYRELLPLIPAILLPVAAHELGHLAILWLLGLKIESIRLEVRGVCIRYSGACGERGHIAAALAGPMGGLLYSASLLLLRLGRVEWLRISAQISLLLTAFNLLPILPLDGGRALRCALLTHLQPDAAERICRAVGAAVCALLALAGVWLGVMRRAGFWPLGMASFLLLRLLTLRLRDGKS